MPLILLREKATGEEKEELRLLLASGAMTPTARNRIAKLVETYQCADLTIQRAEIYTAEAMAALHTFAPSPSRDTLESLANKLLFRFN